MNHDFLSTLTDLPQKHAGVLFEQLHQASLSATFYMRAMGLALPGQANVPTQADVYQHLCVLANNAMVSYLSAQEVAPSYQKANEIWGEEEDSLFSLMITGLSPKEGDGFQVTVDYNLLYRS